ncbi:MAG TPA: branched-chain amino acid ABC transporter ATP-binding protein/permease [Ilumatobacteraceae bacterium]
MKSRRRHLAAEARPLGKFASFAVAAALALLAPRFVGSDILHMSQLDNVIAVALAVYGLNIVFGLGGQLFLGPAALFGSGGYVAAVMARDYTSMRSLEAMCVVSVVVAVLLALVLALPTLRISGFYFGMVTLFLALALPIAATHLQVFGKDAGIILQAVPGFRQSPSGVTLYRIGLVMIGLMIGYNWLILHSRFGRRLLSLRASEEMAQAVGVPLYLTKLVAFIVAAVPCGLGGAYFVYSQQLIAPSILPASWSILALAALMLGGTGSMYGPLIGTAIVVGSTSVLGGLTKYQGIVFGLILIVACSAFPDGIAGLGRRVAARVLTPRSRGRHGLAVGTDAPGELDVDDRDTSAAVDVAGLDAPPAAARVLSLKSVSRSFGGVKAVDGVTLDIEPGVVHALVGANGSGKTTLLNLISGYYALDGGEIWLGESRLDGLSVDRIARAGLARTFQTPKLGAGESALENVWSAIDAHAKGSLIGSTLRFPVSRRADARSRREAKRLLAEMAVEHVADVPAGQLSHGTQRLVEIARAVALRPAVVMLDEPAAGLSVAEVEVLGRVVRGLAESGIAVLIIEHNLPVVFSLASVITVLNGGRIIAQGSPAEVSADQAVIRMFLGRTNTSALGPQTAPSRADFDTKLV